MFLFFGAVGVAYPVEVVALLTLGFAHPGHFLFYYSASSADWILAGFAGG